MKVLVVHYSRTGNTEKVANELANALAADAEAIVDRKGRKGALGYLAAGRDTTKKMPAQIDDPKKDPSWYDLVVIGTPVWVYTVSTPVLAYLRRYSGKFPEVAFFITHGGNFGKTFDDMAAAAGRQPKATLPVFEKDLKKGGHVQQVKEFLAKLQA